MLIAKLKTVGLSMLAALLLVAGAHGLGAQAPAERPKAGNSAPVTQTAASPAPVAQEPRMTAEKLVAKLNEPVNIDKEIENTPIKDVLAFLNDKYGITFIVDVIGFDRDQARRTVEDTPVRIPRIPGVTLRTLLRHLLAQVDGLVLVRKDHLHVVPRTQALCEVYGDDLPNGIKEPRIGQPIVHVISDRQPLEQVLADIADQSGRNIVLDPRVTDREKLTVTAKVLNTPTDTAVRVLAELANLRSVQLDNVFLVTSRERAAELQAEEAKWTESRKQEVKENMQWLREQKRAQQQPAKPNEPTPQKP